MYLCLSCFQVFGNSVLEMRSGSNILCPKADCGGRLVEIDELFVPIITELNMKGYETTFCCSGHIWQRNPNAYIKFKNNIIGAKYLDLGYKLEGDSTGVIIRKRFHGEGLELQKEILDNAIKTYEWVLNLPMLD